MVDDRREVGGSVELNRLQTLVIGLHDTFNTCAVGVLRVPILKRTEQVGGGLPKRINLRCSGWRTRPQLKLQVVMGG